VSKIKNSPVVIYEPLTEPDRCQLSGESCKGKPMSLVQISWVAMPIVVHLNCGPMRETD
jgi:hypothetical protein